MKKAIALALIFVAIIATGITEHFYVEKTFAEFNSKLADLEALIDSGDANSSRDANEELLSWWEKKKNVLETISYCPDIRQINIVIGEIQGSLEADDLKNASSKILSLYQLIINVKNILDFNAKDIV